MKEKIIMIEIITVEYASQELHSLCALTLKSACGRSSRANSPFEGYMITFDITSKKMNYKLKILLLHKLKKRGYLVIRKRLLDN